VSEQVDGRRERWLARPRTGFLVSVLSFAIPIILSIASVFVAALLLPHADSNLSRVLWWIAILAIAWIAAIIGERIARPLLPLASLLKMSLLFPDRAPSRFAVAWRSGSTRQLDRYVHGHDHAHHREPVKVAAEILAMVTALSSHDRRTRGHSERVRAYTDLLAEQLRLPQPDRDRLRWSALLHDVGKISVDVNILNKAGAPSAAEWEILHRHPLEGKRMIEPLSEWLGEWGLAVEQHHENFDGTGYPFGLAGDQISLGARIVAVADAFEVMTAIRSYKSATSPREARKELTRCAGTQFDPVIVRAFLDISVGRQRLVVGPLAWLFDLPIVSQLSNLGNMVAAGSQVAIVAGSMALGTVAAGGQALVHAHSNVDASPASMLQVQYDPIVTASLSTSLLERRGVVRGSAEISNAAANASGTMTYLVYGNDGCSGTPVVTLAPVNVTNGVANSSSWSMAGRSGTYYFVASYSGDASDKSSISGCGANPFEVNTDVTTIITELSASAVATGGQLYASATITSDSASLKGSVTYDVYDNDTCSSADGGLVNSFGPLAIANGVVPESPNWTAGSAGHYYFVTSYSGDANNKASVSGCAAAEVTVAVESSTTSTSPSSPGTVTALPPTTTSPVSTTTTTNPPTTTTTTKSSPTTTTTTKPPPTTTTTTKPPPTTTTTKPPPTTTTTTTPLCLLGLLCLAR
jgi:HD-GYP domain-containing protein (c-di-GMP phosphodiesterase class II)